MVNRKRAVKAWTSLETKVPLPYGGTRKESRTDHGTRERKKEFAADVKNAVQHSEF